MELLKNKKDKDKDKDDMLGLKTTKEITLEKIEELKNPKPKI